MITEKTNLEKYLAGEPLTEEIAELRNGAVQPELASFDGFFARVPSEDKPLTAEERQLLKQARANGVLATLIRCQKRALQKHVLSATMDSENDPLARSAEVSRQWAYVAMYRRATLELEQLVNAEIRELEGER